MNMDYLKQNKHLARPVLLGVSVVLAALTAAKLWDYRSTSARAQSIVAKAVDQDRAEPDLLKKNLAEFAKIAEALKKKNLFVPPAAKRHPVSSVLGIMGNEALVNGKWYKVGDKISDAEIVAVEPTLVKIKWGGKVKSFSPIGAAVAAAPKPVARVAEAPKAKGKKEKPVKSDGKAKKAIEFASGKKDPLAWMGTDLPSKLRGKLLKMWNNASEEQRREGMAEWKKASKAQRKQILASLDSRGDR